MIMKGMQKEAFKNAISTAFYVAFVGIFMYLGGEAKIGRSNTFFVPIAFLLLLVTSAAITGYLIFGKPVQLYIDGKKKEALTLLKSTLIFFSSITFIAILLLLAFSR